MDTADDSGLLWLKTSTPSDVNEAVARLQANDGPLNLGAGSLLFGAPLQALYGQNERTPRHHRPAQGRHHVLDQRQDGGRARRRGGGRHPRRLGRRRRRADRVAMTGP